MEPHATAAHEAARNLVLAAGLVAIWIVARRTAGAQVRKGRPPAEAALIALMAAVPVMAATFALMELVGR